MHVTKNQMKLLTWKIELFPKDVTIWIEEKTKSNNQKSMILFIENQKMKTNFENKTCHRYLIVGCSGYGKSYLMKNVFLKKQGPIF